MGNNIQNDIIFYFIVGKNIDIDKDIIERIFPNQLNTNERYYSFDKLKVKWISTIIGQINDGNWPKVKYKIKENRKNVFLIFGDNEAEILCEKIKGLDEVFRPLLVFVTKKKIEKIKMPDNRIIKNIVYNEDKSKLFIEIM